MSLVPYVIEQTARGERSYDIFSRLLNDRIVMLSEDVNSTTASLVVAQLLYLEGQDPEKDISFYINSPGGSITDGMAIYDTMRYIKCDVSTICVGMAASMASVLLAAGTKGKISSDYAERLENCSPGRDLGADRQYEAICSAILRELFAADFDIMKEQLETTEGLFRMDMVCSIKLTNRDSFWGFLKHFYRTNYVVFEFKNYSDEVSQNPVCITEKYLSSMALRNVAFIISRKGFDKSAQKVALKSLKEHGNLIISLTDDDLLKMLTIKEDNREPSGYLMDKLNELLMYAD